MGLYIVDALTQAQKDALNKHFKTKDGAFDEEAFADAFGKSYLKAFSEAQEKLMDDGMKYVGISGKVRKALKVGADFIRTLAKMAMVWRKVQEQTQAQGLDASGALDAFLKMYGETNATEEGGERKAESGTNQSGERKAESGEATTDDGTRYSIVSKEGYWRKMMYAQRRNQEDKDSVTTLTEEQHDALAELAGLRHEMHSRITRLLENTDRSNDIANHFGEVINKLEELGLDTSALPYIDSTVTPESTDIYDEDIDGDYEEYYERIVSEGHEWWENINTQIEAFLGSIDDEHGTHYKPGGYTRFSVGSWKDLGWGGRGRGWNAHANESNNATYAREDGKKPLKEWSREDFATAARQAGNEPLAKLIEAKNKIPLKTLRERYLDSDNGEWHHILVGDYYVETEFFFLLDTYERYERQYGYEDFRNPNDSSASYRTGLGKSLQEGDKAFLEADTPEMLLAVRAWERKVEAYDKQINAAQKEKDALHNQWVANGSHEDELYEKLKEINGVKSPAYQLRQAQNELYKSRPRPEKLTFPERRYSMPGIDGGIKLSASPLQAMHDIADGKVGVIQHADEGEIEYAIGNEDEGLIHIIQERMQKEHVSLEDAIETAIRVAEVVYRGRKISEDKTGFRLSHRGYIAVIGTVGNKHVLTGFQLDKNYKTQVHKKVLPSEFPTYAQDPLGVKSRVVAALRDKLSQVRELTQEEIDRKNKKSTKYSIPNLYTGARAPYSKPDMHYVGTGEGAQVFGYGLYASNKYGVARSYADRYNGSIATGTLDREKYRYDGLRISDAFPFLEDEDFNPVWEAMVNNDKPAEEAKDLRDNAIKTRRTLEQNINRGYYGTEERKAKWLREIEALRVREAKYENAIEALKDFNWSNLREISESTPSIHEQTWWTHRAPGDESHLIEWTKRISKENANRILTQLQKELGEPGERDELAKMIRVLTRGILPTGEQLYNHLNLIFAHEYEDTHTFSKRTSEFLYRADIDGVKYPVDATKGYTDYERGANYVAFSDEHLQVDHQWQWDGSRYEQKFSMPNINNVENRIQQNYNMLPKGTGYERFQKINTANYETTEAKNTTAGRTLYVRHSRIHGKVQTLSFTRLGFTDVKLPSGEHSPSRRTQGLLNKVYASLELFSEITGVPIEALSLGGNLHIEITDESDTFFSVKKDDASITISNRNTSDLSVFFCFVHEWFHALDFMLAQGKDFNLLIQGRLSNPSSAGTRTLAREEIQSAFHDAVLIAKASSFYGQLKKKDIDERDKIKEMFERNGDKYNGKYYTENHEALAYAFEGYVYTLLSEDGELPYNKKQADNLPMPHLNEADTGIIFKAFDILFSTFHVGVNRFTGTQTLYSMPNLRNLSYVETQEGKQAVLAVVDELLRRSVDGKVTAENVVDGLYTDALREQYGLKGEKKREIEDYEQYIPKIFRNPGLGAEAYLHVMERVAEVMYRFNLMDGDTELNNALFRRIAQYVQNIGPKPGVTELDAAAFRFGRTIYERAEEHRGCAPLSSIARRTASASEKDGRTSIP